MSNTVRRYARKSSGNTACVRTSTNSEWIDIFSVFAIMRRICALIALTKGAWNMHRITQFSEYAQNLISEIDRLRILGKREEALQRYDQAIQHSERLPHEEREELMIGRQLLARALDPTYRPQPLNHDRDILPLIMNGRHYRDIGDHEQALRYLWAYFQFCSSGTWTFQCVLADLTECAANNGDWEMARQFASMCISHYGILQTASKHIMTPIGITAPGLQHEWPDVDGLLDLRFPYHTALQGIAQFDNSCWVRILELHVEVTPREEHQQIHFQKAIEALRCFYTSSNDQIKLGWLQEYRPAQK
jgi:tetratricopeptide (TPR) repeat protein